jgi:hypothetical protein
MTAENLRTELYNVAMRGIRFSLSLPDTPFVNRSIDRFFGNFLKGVIDAAVTFDEKIAGESITKACAWISSVCGQRPHVSGAENIPAEGPVLLVSNHPGYFEGMLIIGQLPRSDIRIVVGGVPYFTKLPNARQFIFYTDHTESENVKALRRAVSHLKTGGSFLIFPTGQADPDPDAMPGSRQRLDDWSESVALMLRRVPETRLVPAIVSGIVKPGYLWHPLALIQRSRRPRIRVAELLQMYRQFGTADYPPISRPRLTIGKPISGAELIAQVGKRKMMSEVIRRAGALLDAHIAQPARW